MTINIYPVTDIESPKDPKDGHYGYLLQAVEDRKVKGFCIGWKPIRADTLDALTRAVEEAAGRITDPDSHVLILSDNEAVISGILNLHRWQQDGWRRSRGRRISREENWKRISKALEGKKIAAQKMSRTTMYDFMRQIKEKKET